MDGTGTDHGAQRIYIREAAELLHRRMATLRKWEQLGVLPRHLLPHRGEREWRYWTPEQIVGLQEWLVETSRHPGKGLPFYNPTADDLEAAQDLMRRPRKCHLCEKAIRKSDRYTRIRGKGCHLNCVLSGLPENMLKQDAA